MRGLLSYTGRSADWSDEAMSTYTINKAKTHLSSLIEQACAGEEIIIAQGKQPLVKLVPLQAPGQGRRFGAMRGRAKVGEAFFEPLPDDERRPRTMRFASSPYLTRW